MAKALIIVLFAISTCSNFASSEWCRRDKSSSLDIIEPETANPVEDKINIPQCSGNPDSLVSGRLVNGSSTRGETLLPKWANLTLARQGQKFASDRIPLISSSHIFGLMFVLTFPDAYTVLLFTNQSDTPDRAAKRYESTIKQVNTWYTKELKETPDDNEALDSLLRVRGLHTAAMTAGNERLHADKTNLINSYLYERVPIDNDMWTAFQKDLEASNIPEENRKLPESHSSKDGSFYAVSQFQLAMTQYAFVGFPVLFPERLNIIDASDEDLYAYNHLWAILGYALGIDDEYNVALQPDLKSTREYYQKIFDDWYTPNLFNLDFHCKLLLEAMLKGFEQINDVLTPKTLLLRLLRDIVNIPTPNMRRELSPKDHAKMLEFFTKGIQGFLDKISGDIRQMGLPAVIQNFRENGGPAKVLQQIRNKLPQFPRPPGH